MILTEAINFIESGLCEPITRKAAADHCYVSLSSLEKLFRYALNLGIKDYIERRRMTRAADDIVNSEMSVTDVAMKYQYNSTEVFSRSFKRVWNVNPSEFRDNRRFTGIFPKINYVCRKGDDFYMAQKRVDISEAYDYLRGKKGSYVLCFDMRHLTEINALSSKAGDHAILEMVSRIDGASSDEMCVLRIGGDEFALITGFYDLEEAEGLRESILKRNGEPILFEGKSLPLSLWCGIIKIPDSLRYDDFFNDMHAAIEKSKA
jgi:AraC family transcriptional regulator